MTVPHPQASARVHDLLAQMTLEEKAAQLVGYWVDQGGEVVAPLADEMVTTTKYADATAHGLGHLTRVYGTRPVDPVERAAWLWEEQRRLRADTRLGIPAIVHEECLTGLAAWKAATYPTPLAWGASFDPELVAEMGAAIGDSMRELGIHQGLAPVLDVIRDPRWGRVDECIGEDPYLVGTVGTAYVRGVQSAGVDATLKHFVGYSASQAARNHAPVHAGPREVADVLLPPFEMAIRDGGAASVMNSYAEIDGEPVAASAHYLDEVLRGRLGFAGPVVSDYFSVAFLQTTHGVAGDLGEAAELALRAGIDVELPTGDAFAAPMLERIRSGEMDAALLDAAVLRVLAQKERLGLLDETFETPPAAVDLDGARHRDLARRLAAESVVLVSNDGTLPAASARRIALIGPNADSAEALMGCYSFVNHVLAHHPGTPHGIDLPTVRDAFVAEYPDAEIAYARGCGVEDDDDSAIGDAVDAAAAAELAVVVVGDRAGLFGRGTVGEGNDVDDLELPGLQRQLVERVVATGTPVVLVILSGRPYAIGWALDGERRVAAALQSFFPGEEGADPIAGIVSGRLSPSGRLPVTLPRSAGAQPYSYLHPRLGGPIDVTSADPTPVRPFGHGLTYTTFAHEHLQASASVAAGDTLEVSVVARNTGERAGADVVQLYAHDPVASLTRPVAQLMAYHRVDLGPGESARVVFSLPTARFAFTGRDGRRVVEPGRIDLWVGSSCEDRESVTAIEVTGEHVVTHDDARIVPVRVVADAELVSPGR
ncbi:beta-xylosidase/alpha-l-arabinosidase [Microbacterium aquilitoris]|uniref:beta-xylosidase/alpha-l-arabinosidase n=1 Tax=Microbacterium aquilitoris TaxID=3067307 RepID=UPI00288E3609|nr:glycoside hydrolase family 3 N-terminal domain-containing protein [Microbacterium sp. KSW2-22]MDT3345608.1 glycoside hydrolase family 3 N-terminal domain-containing protein [Microbacterium sp. KSW2-22]